MIDDLPGIVQDSQCALFADDFKIYKEIENEQDAILLQSDLDRVYEWSLKNRLSFNIEKCYSMSITRKNKKIIFQYKINNKSLNKKTECKDLGVTIDEKLSFEKHTTNIVNKAYRMLGFIIRNSFRFTKILTLEMLYNSFVRSILEYAGIIWSPYYIIYTNAIEKVQKFFLRFLYYKKHGEYIYNLSYKASLAEFHLNSLEFRRKVATVLFLYKLLCNKIDNPELLSKINFNCNPYLNIRKRNIFVYPKPRTNLGLSSPLYNMCFLGNALDIDYFSIKNLKTFRKHVEDKLILFEKINY